MMKGVDLSHHQNDVVFKNAIRDYDFIILKATEGKTYTDPTFTSRFKELQRIKKLRGIYHYARPENNNVNDEVENFLKAWNGDEECLLILDWEGKALTKEFTWALDFCQIVKARTGVTPIIYASASTIKKYSRLYRFWWTAHYNKACEDGCVHDDVDEIMTQYSSTPIDFDTFRGTTTDWMKLTAKVEEPSQDVAQWEDDEYRYFITRVKK